MTTLLAIFILALAFSLVLTPLAGRLGTHLGAVDMPAPRKVHTTPLPRAGGLAVFLSFVATIALTNLYETNITDLIVFDRRTAFSFYGALVVFGCGLWDDFRRLNPRVKLLFQILGATIAFAGGVSIGGFFLGGHGIQFGIFSYVITVFWFLLFINAVNLIDGLDGLASGVVFFASLLMVISSRNAVLILYGVTVALCFLAILIVNLRSEMVGMILVILGIGALILLRKSGYLEYLRRSFLSNLARLNNQSMSLGQKRA